MSESTNGSGRAAALPAALFVTVLLQSAGALIWAGAASERIAELERDVAAKPVLLERTARLEAQTALVREQLNRIEAKLDAKR